jgi:alkyl sulfatase BDS1-like metallo-beta-lactamase superfamily hydrolase
MNTIMNIKLNILLIMLVFFSSIIKADTKVTPTLALNMLNQQNQQFTQQVIHVSKNVYTAVGFHGANTSMIVGEDGVIIIDTLMGPTSAKEAVKALRQHSIKPVKAIIYTHSHDDHTGGARAFISQDKTDIYAMHNFGSSLGVDESLRPILLKRGIRQFGRQLSAHEATNRGLAPAVTIDHDRGDGYLTPTIKISSASHKVSIAGIDLEMYAGSGETSDALFVWLPEEKVLFSGDNFYQTFPNLYAIRGTPYRDVMNWSNSVAHMAKFKPHYLVPGHTLPIKGQSKAVMALSDYSEAIRLVYEQTINGINQGKSPDLLAHEVKLPPHLREKPYLIEFYGNIPHAVRAIYAGLLGWFDGNPTTLSPLEPKVKAQKIAELAGGIEKLTQQMLQALNNKDYQWTLVLSDHLKWLDGADKVLVRRIKIRALRQLASQEYNAPNRNYYLSYANELESGQLSSVWF